MADSVPDSAGRKAHCRFRIYAPLSMFFAGVLAVSCSSSPDSFLGFTPSAIQESAALETSSPEGLATDDENNIASAPADADGAESEGEQAVAAEAPSSENTDNPPERRSVFANLFASPGQNAVEAARMPAQADGEDAPAPGNENRAAQEPQSEAKAIASQDKEEDDSAPAKRSLLSAFFASESTAAKAEAIATEDEKSDAPQPTMRTASLVSQPDAKPSAMWDDPLPGVRSNAQLFEISRGSGTNDDSDIDLYEQVGSYEVASAAGLARLAPNGLLKQRESVDVSCFKPQLVHMLKTIERHFGKRVVVTSGYRSPAYNRRVRGARNSMHMQCAAADIQVAGVSKWELARFTRSLPRRGGVGTYCHTKSVHVDVGPKRDWNWRCRR